MTAEISWTCEKALDKNFSLTSRIILKFKTAQQMKVFSFKLFRLNFLETVACALVVGVLWTGQWSVRWL